MPSPYKTNYGVTTVTAATYSLTAAADAGKTVVSNLAATQTFTLPASSGSGNTYTIYIKTTKTGNMVIQVANSTDVINGNLHLTTDIAGTSMPTAATTDTITMNGTTTGGLAGSWVEVQDVATGFWALRGGLNCSGTEATPFSAAV